MAKSQGPKNGQIIVPSKCVIVFHASETCCPAHRDTIHARHTVIDSSFHVAMASDIVPTLSASQSAKIDARQIMARTGPYPGARELSLLVPVLLLGWKRACDCMSKCETSALQNANPLIQHCGWYAVPPAGWGNNDRN